MKVKPNQDFKHNRKMYKKGRSYEVSSEDADYFASVGWVGQPAETGKEQSLEIHDGVLGQKSEVIN